LSYKFRPIKSLYRAAFIAQPLSPKAFIPFISEHCEAKYYFLVLEKFGGILFQGIKLTIPSKNLIFHLISKTNTSVA